MPIRIPFFSGFVRKASPRLLQDDVATYAKNLLIESGQLRPIHAPVAGEVLQTLNTETIYRYANAHWFSWQEVVHAVPGPLADDVTDRVYFTGQDYPRVTRNDIALGAGAKPSASYRLGIPAPDAPTVAITGTGPEEDQVQTAWVQTFITAWGEEGPPSAPSAVHDMRPGQTATLALGATPSGSYNLAPGASRRIYRLNTGGGGTDYQLVATVPIATASYADSTLAQDLGAVLPIDSAEFRIGPPDDNTALYPTGPMLGLTALPNGVLAGFTGKTLCFCEPYKPHWWPLSYRINLEFEIVAIAAVGDGLAIGTVGKPYLCLGSHPSSMTLVPLESLQACVSARSMVDLGTTAIYASPDGLVGVDRSAGAQLLTEGLLNRAQWQSYKPESIRGFALGEGRYLGFYDTGTTKAGFIFDPAGGKNALVELDLWASAGCNDLLQDKLFLAIDDQIYEWGAGSPLAYQWVSKEFVEAREVNFSWIKVDARTYPVTVKVVADGVERFSQTITSNRETRLPGGFLARVWQVTVEGTATVDSVQLAEDVEELL